METPERHVLNTRLISAIDKARPEVIIDVELLEDPVEVLEPVPPAADAPVPVVEEEPEEPVDDAALLPPPLTVWPTAPLSAVTVPANGAVSVVSESVFWS